MLVKPGAGPFQIFSLAPCLACFFSTLLYNTPRPIYTHTFPQNLPQVGCAAPAPLPPPPLVPHGLTWHVLLL